MNPNTKHAQPGHANILARLIARCLASHGVTAHEIAARIYPDSASGEVEPDRKRDSFAGQIERLAGPSPHPDDAGLDLKEALALDRVFGFPCGLCLLICALNDAASGATEDREFLDRIRPLPRRADLDGSYLVIAPTGPEGSIAFVDGRFPGERGSFPADQ